MCRSGVSPDKVSLRGDDAADAVAEESASLSLTSSTLAFAASTVSPGDCTVAATARGSVGAYNMRNAGSLYGEYDAMARLLIGLIGSIRGPLLLAFFSVARFAALSARHLCWDEFFDWSL